MCNAPYISIDVEKKGRLIASATHNHVSVEIIVADIHTGVFTTRGRALARINCRMKPKVASARTKQKQHKQTKSRKRFKILKIKNKKRDDDK